MPVKYVAFVSFLWVCAVFLGAILSESFVTDKPSDLDIVTSGPFIRMPVEGTGDVRLPKPNLEFFPAIWRMATFNYGFLQQGGWQMVRWIVFFPLTAMFVYGITAMFIGMLEKRA